MPSAPTTSNPSLPVHTNPGPEVIATPTVVPAAPVAPVVPVSSDPQARPDTQLSRPAPPAPGTAVPPKKGYVCPPVPPKKPKEDHTLMNSFTIEQIETHIASLNTGLQLPPLELKKKCLEVLKCLMAHEYGWVFNAPVDPVELKLPDYFQVVKKPMDLGSIKKRLENGCYHDIKEFEAEVNLTFDNATLYNINGSVVHNMAKEMKLKFKQDFKKLLAQLSVEEDEKRKNGEACALCGCEKLLFEPHVFYCNGANCPSKRIRRNSYYYVGANNQYHWCHTCFG